MSSGFECRIVRDKIDQVDLHMVHARRQCKIDSKLGINRIWRSILRQPGKTACHTSDWNGNHPHDSAFQVARCLLSRLLEVFSLILLDACLCWFEAGCAASHRYLPLHTESDCTPYYATGFKVDQECCGMLDYIQRATPLGPLGSLQETTSF